MTRRPGYVLVVDPELLDAGRFERLVAEAGWLLGVSRPGRQGWWRWGWVVAGAALAEFAGQPWAQAAARLEELRLAGQERLAELGWPLVAMVGWWGSWRGWWRLIRPGSGWGGADGGPVPVGAAG